MTPISYEEIQMEEIVKKIKAPAKPRKSAAKKEAAATNGAVHAEGTTRSNVTEMKPSHDQVALLAHRYWAERGRQHGHDAEDWFRAEQDLRGMAS
jgi:hypothetical protein